MRNSQHRLRRGCTSQPCIPLRSTSTVTPARVSVASLFLSAYDSFSHKICTSMNRPCAGVGYCALRRAAHRQSAESLEAGESTETSRALTPQDSCRRSAPTTEFHIRRGAAVECPENRSNPITAQPLAYLHATPGRRDKIFDSRIRSRCNLKNENRNIFLFKICFRYESIPISGKPHRVERMSIGIYRLLKRIGNLIGRKGTFSGEHRYVRFQCRSVMEYWWIFWVRLQ